MNRPLGAALVVSLLVAALPILDAQERAPGLEVPGATHAAAVSTGDALEVVSGELPLALTVQQRERLDHLWVWSAECPVTRIEPADLESAACAPAAAWAQVRLRWPPSLHSRPGPPPGFLLAAPTEAWAEIPEQSLPRFAAGENGVVRLPLGPSRDLRLRFAGERSASAWLDLGEATRSIDLHLLTAIDRSIAVLDAEGRPLSEGFVSLFRPGRLEDEYQALVAVGPRGTARLDGLPRSLELAAVASSRGMLPRRVLGTVERLPAEIRLERGCTLVGEVRDGEGAALAEVRLRAEGYSGDGSGLLIESAARSVADGSFRLGPLPLRPVGLALSRSGYARATKRLLLAECPGELDLGTITLDPALRLPVAVRDAEGRPVAGAAVSAASGEEARTDARGRTVLEGIPPRDALEVSVGAAGYRDWRRTLSPPLPAELLVSLERAAQVTGRLVDADGLPLGGGTVEVSGQNRVYDEPIAGDGTFAVELDPGVAVELRLRSPVALEVLRRVPPLAAGELHDLGDVGAPAGMSVVGRLWRADTAEPVAGARVWSARTGGAGGAIAAWALGHVVETWSDVEGGFRLSGLTPGPGALRIEASGLAPREVVVRPAEEGGADVDLGDLFLDAGATLHVVGDSRWSGVARADWRGQWLEMDMISASYGGGEAWLEHVPAGEAVVTVLDGNRLHCEQHVEVPAEGTLEVDCGEGGLRVRGVVTVGGEPAGPGKLSWLAPTGGDTLVMNRRTASGATEAQIFGAGRPQVDVAVGPDGWFASEVLAPGAWDVFWHPAGGGGGRHREVELPDEGDVELELAFSPYSLDGWVLDEEGEPVAGARVEDVDGRAATRTGADGAFLLLDLEPGPRRLRALAGERRSAVVTAEVPIEGRGEPVVLVLDREGDERVRVDVWIGEEPAAGAFVFLELEGQGLRILTADASGVARAGLLPPRPRRLRAAAIAGPHVALGGWAPTEDVLAEGLVLTVSESGGLEVVSTGYSGAVEVVGPGGWKLSSLFARLGSPLRVSADGPLLVHGLPPGSYEVGAGESHWTVQVEPGRIEGLELD